MAEQPWPAGPVDAVVDWTPIDLPGYDGVGVLWFLSPETEGWHAGKRCPIHVSRSVGDEGSEIPSTDSRFKTNVWRISEEPNGLLRVCPSVHFVDHFHSPRPVFFRPVEKLADDDG